RNPNDPFLCYRAKVTENTPPFSSISGVHLRDGTTDIPFLVAKLLNLCTPADVDGDGILDPITHLSSFSLKADAGSKPPVRTAVSVLNVLGQFSFDAKVPAFLLVPTAKNLTSPPPTPNPATSTVDHYECYKAKISKGTPKFQPTQIDVGDQFTA